MIILIFIYIQNYQKIIFNLYLYHAHLYTYGPPMAVAPIENVNTVLNYALTEIAPQKIFLGIPNYAYDWKLPYIKGESKAVTMGNLQAIRLAQIKGAEIKFDEKSKAPFFNYTADDGTEHVVWFEDARSIQAKFEFIPKNKLLGTGYWNIMRPFPQNWALLNDMFYINKIQT